MDDRPPERLPALFPREHGASMELLFALLTAFCLAPPTSSAIALGGSAILVFVAHEPFMVLIGRRGPRRRVAQSADAWRTMIALGVVAAGLLALAVHGISTLALSTLVIPLALGVPAVVLALRGRERSVLAELLVVGALTSVAIPVALASDVPLDEALEASAVWLVCFTVGTLAARGVLYRAKDRGRGSKLAIIVAMIVAALAILSAALGWLSVRHGLALLPSTLVAIVIGLRPPTPKQMSRLGLGLTAASLVSFLLIVL